MRERFRHRSLSLCFVLLSASAMAQAAPAPDVPTSGPTSGPIGDELTAEARAQSRELALEAQERFRAGEPEAAAALLIEARQLYPEPLLLYNLARVYESAGDNQESLDAYERYVMESPDAPDRAAIDLRIHSLRDTIARLNAPPIQQAPPPSGPGAWPWVVCVSGVAILAAGGVLGGLARSARNKAVEDPIHETTVSQTERAERLAVSANVLFVVGSVVSAIGITWLIVGAVGSGDEENTSLSVVFGPTGVAMRGTW